MALPSNVISIEMLVLLTPVLKPDETFRRVKRSSVHFVTDSGFIISVGKKKANRSEGSQQSRHYRQASITLKDGTRYRPLMHGLVAEAFLGERPVDEFGRPYEVHHINGDRQQNHVSNLCYMSKAEHAKITRRSIAKRTKLNRVTVWKGRCRTLSEPFNVVVASVAEARGAKSLTVSQALRGRTWADVPMPTGDISVTELAQALDVPLDEAVDLLALAYPDSFGRMAA